MIIIRPELAKVVEGGADDGEALGPHTFRKEGRDTNEAVARDGVGGARGLEFLGSREREESIGDGFKRVEKGNGDAVVNDLDCPPGSKGIGEKMGGVGERKVNQRDRF